MEISDTTRSLVATPSSRQGGTGAAIAYRQTVYHRLSRMDAIQKKPREPERYDRKNGAFKLNRAFAYKRKRGTLNF
jgi:hypothetical protein